MPTQTILAVAIGDPAQSRTISEANNNLSGVRPYVVSLINYLSNNGYSIGVDYTVDYRECYEDNEDFTGSGNSAVILCMSTPVVRKGAAVTSKTPIVGVFSNPTAEGFDKKPNVCGVNAQRIQNARQYYDRFINTVKPKLKAVYVLHRVGNTASNGCLGVMQKGDSFSVPMATLDVSIAPQHDMQTLINGVPPGSGLLVLPVDVFFGAKDFILQCAQARSLPVFWPTPDGVPGAIVSYGVSQSDCGQLMGEQVKYILDNRGAIPEGKARFVTASTAKWVASRAVAKALKIELCKDKKLLLV